MTPPTDERLAPRSTLGIVLWLLVGATSLVYLVNPTAGLLEAIPDNVPVVGNLDEATATFLVLSALQYLTGISLPGRRRSRVARSALRKP